jgi:RNA polymerase sigma-70 factor (ECF subfamily)
VSKGAVSWWPYRLGAINVVTLRDGRIAELTGFLDPALGRRFALPEKFAGPR